MGNCAKAQSSAQKGWFRSKLSTGAPSGGLSLLIAAGAAAQTSDDARSEVTPRPEIGEVVVTGTQVLRDGFESPTPVSVLSTEDIEAAGILPATVLSI